MPPTPAPMTLTDYIHDLTQWRNHREPYSTPQRNTDGTITWITQAHITRTPPLMTQLWEATHQAAQKDEGGRAGYASKPTARLDALDAAARIDIAASRWVRDLGEDDPGDTITCLLRLNGLAASADRPAMDAMTRDARSWWTQARVLTGWDSAAWKPTNTCPLCGTKGSLRVKLSAQAATCVDCHEVWDAVTIGLLADHIRAENREDEADGEEHQAAS